MTATTRQVAILLSLTLSAVCYASEADRATQKIVQDGSNGRIVRSVTVDPSTGAGNTFDFGQQNPGDLPGLAIGELLWGVSDPTGLMDNVAIADDGSIAAVGISLNNFNLRVIDAVSGAINYEVPGVDGLSAVAVTPVGEEVIWCQSHSLRVFPGTEGNELWSVTVPDDHFYSGIGVSHDGEQIVVLETFGADSLYFSLYGIDSSTPIWRRALPMMTTNNQWIGARFSSDGMKIVATSRFRIFVLDATNGDMIWNEDGRNTEQPATISGDGRIITCGSNNDGKLHVYAWDQGAETYIQLWEYRFSGGTSNWATATGVSENGETIAAGSLQFTAGGFEGYVAVFETNGGGTPLWVSAGMGDLVGGIEISDDGLTIAACSWGYLADGAPDIRVFQKYDSEPFYTYTHPGSPNDLDLSADGTHLIAGGKAVHNRFFGNGGNAYCFSLDLEGGSVAGNVTLAGTGDYSGVTIEAVGTHLRTTTNAQGAYRLEHIPAGSYTITATKLGFTWGTAANVVITEDGLTNGVNFSLAETEAAPQNLVAVSGQLRRIDLSWSALGATAQNTRELEALWAVGDVLVGPMPEENPVRLTADDQNAAQTAPRPRRPNSLDDPDSIHVWRSALSGGPYSLIRSLPGTVSSYGDSIGVIPTRTYYYVVTGVYSNGESEYSNEAVGALDDSYLVYDPVVPPMTTPVTFDGVLSQNEWADAVRIDISDIFGTDSPNPPQTAFLYMKYNDTTDLLYLACEDHANTSLDDAEGFGIYVDDDDSDTWSYDRSGSEGNYWAYYYGSGSTLRYRSLSGAPYNADPYFTFTNPQIGFSTSAGYFTGEVAIPMGFQELYQLALYGPDKTPGIGFFVIQRQAGVAIFDGWWPQNIPSIVSNPEYFSNTSIQASLHVPPAAPGEVEVARNGLDLQVDWIDPTQGIDDLPLTGLTGLKLYRNGEFLDYIQVGVQSYTDENVTYGAWYEYSVSGFIMDGDDEYEGPLSLAEGAYAGEEPELEYLTYDDGVWEFFMIVSGTYDENRFAVRCDMPDNRDFVYTVQIAVNSIAPIGVGIADDDGGIPGAQQFGPYFITPPVMNEFFTVHIPGDNLPAPVGPFWATLDWTQDRPWEPGIATDNSSNEGRSYWHQGSTGWQNQPSNFMVRAGVGDFVSDADGPHEGLVHEYGLMANYPNPFNPETMIPFSLAKAGEATLSIYNITGQRVATLVDGKQPAGHHIARWNGHDDAGKTLASGIYFARLDAGTFSQTKKLMMLK